MIPDVDARVLGAGAAGDLLGDAGEHLAKIPVGFAAQCDEPRDLGDQAQVRLAGNTVGDGVAVNMPAHGQVGSEMAVKAPATACYITASATQGCTADDSCLCPIPPGCEHIDQAPYCHKQRRVLARSDVEPSRAGLRTASRSRARGHRARALRSLLPALVCSLGLARSGWWTRSRPPSFAADSRVLAGHGSRLSGGSGLLR